MKSIGLSLLLGQLLTATAIAAQSSQAGYSPQECPNCAEWNARRDPVRIFGNVYWVGTKGLGAILIVSDSGHVLIDAGLPESAPLVEQNVRALGYNLRDIRVILNSHAHYDHAGGVAALQHATGAEVLASAASAAVLRRGLPGLEDPQHDTALAFPPVHDVKVVGDGDTVRVGSLALVAHLTPGHSPGGTTWTWRSCEAQDCVAIVYADSQTPVSAGAYRFSEGDRAATFEHGLDVIENLECDILLTPHPGASRLWQRVAARDAGDQRALIDRDACRRYASRSRQQLAARLDRERSGSWSR